MLWGMLISLSMYGHIYFEDKNNSLKNQQDNYNIQMNAESDYIVSNEAKLLESFTPVSYTHLDVYKRQMHTQRAVMAVHRMISLFPGEQQEEIRNQISQVLRAVICQRLLRWNKKFITIRDILLNTHAVANLIRTRKEPQIISIQETQLPMKTLEMAVRDVKAQYGAQQQLHTLLDQQLS